LADPTRRAAGALHCRACDARTAILLSGSLIASYITSHPALLFSSRFSALVCSDTLADDVVATGRAPSPRGQELADSGLLLPVILRLQERAHGS
jgi:hypothetical protein